MKMFLEYSISYYSSFNTTMLEMSKLELIRAWYVIEWQNSEMTYDATRSMEILLLKKLRFTITIHLIIIIDWWLSSLNN